MCCVVHFSCKGTVSVAQNTGFKFHWLCWANFKLVDKSLAFVSGSSAGIRYFDTAFKGAPSCHWKFFLTSGASALWNEDPRLEKQMNSAGGGIIWLSVLVVLNVGQWAVLRLTDIP